MRDHFELRTADGAGRIGELTVPRAGVTVETPALLPVINPNIVTVEPARLSAEFGAEMLITNSYIIRNTDDLRQRALDEGLHELLGFDGAIMTDSGSFQLAEYGEIDVTTEEILAFQHDIGSDVATPVDIPTPPDMSRERAVSELADTERALTEAEALAVGEMLLNAPVQGSTHLDLREQAARNADRTDLDVFPIGAVVPLMEAYRFDDVVEIVGAAKRGLGADAPVHLFGAGHPMLFALAVAAGCDLFDSAAYALYARDDRYLTVRGTRQLADLEYFPCSCPVCVAHAPDDVRAIEGQERERVLAEHNLHVSFTEIRRIRQAIRAGNLLELVEARARSHPAVLDGYRALLADADRLEKSDPTSKGTFFHLSGESARRPEVLRHHQRLDRLGLHAESADRAGSDSDRVDVDSDCVDADPNRVGTDADTADADDDRAEATDGWPEVLLTEGNDPSGDQFDVVWRVLPPFGPFPRALSETYPLTAETPDRRDHEACVAAAEGVRLLVDANPEASFTLAHDDWPAAAVEQLPERVTVEQLGVEDDAGG